MIRNTAGQSFFLQALTAAGAPVTTGVTGVVAKDVAADGAITGSVTHIGNGKWRCDPSQADTDGDYLGFTFSGGGMVPVTVFFDTRVFASSVPINVAADGQVVTSGTVISGDYTDTSTINQIYFQTQVAAGALDVELFFDLPTSRVGQGIAFTGRFDGGAGGANRQNFVALQLYDYDTAAFEQIGAITNTQSVDVNFAVEIPRRMTAPSTDPNPGRVRMRFLLGQGENGNNLYIDRALVSSVFEDAVSVGDLIRAMRATIPELVYQNGSVWVDTNRGSSGRTVGFNGVPFGLGGSGPSNNVADAIAIASQLNTRTLLLSGDSSFTLDGDVTDGTFIGRGGGKVDLNNQIIDSCEFRNLTIDGTVNASRPPSFNECILNNVTGWGVFVQCRLPGGTSLTLNAPLSILDRCFDFEPGTASFPVIDCNNIPGLQLKINDYTGELKLVNVAANATVSINDIDGYLDISDASISTSATFNLSGVGDFTGTPRGAINDVARISQATDLDTPDTIETGFSKREALRIMLANAAGDLSGAGTPNETLKAADKSKTRITATVDIQGNRTTILDKT